jgi:hypothetical protein
VQASLCARDEASNSAHGTAGLFDWGCDFSTAPAKELTGGPWYTEQEFDHEFIDHITETIMHLIETQESQGQMASLSWVRVTSLAESSFSHANRAYEHLCLSQIAERIQVSGVSTVELTTEEVQLLLNTMVYDRKIEEVPPAVMRLTVRSAAMMLSFHSDFLTWTTFYGRVTRCKAQSTSWRSLSIPSTI